MSGSVLACDLGTSALKASLVADDGRVLAHASEPIPTHRPHDAWAEQDPDGWFAALARATRRVLSETPERPDALGVVAQMSAWLGVDRAGAPVAPAAIWADLRAAAESDQVAAACGAEALYALTGNRVGPTYPLPRWMWMKRHAPEAEARAQRLLQPKDYLVARLCGAAFTDPSDASCTLMFDLAAGRWAPEIPAAFGLDPAKLPEIRPSTSVVGHVTPHAAALTGIRAGTPVVCGAGDGPAAALGAGATRPGDAYLNVGTSAWISAIADRPTRDPSVGVVNFAHAVPGAFAVTASSQNAGHVLDWALQAFAAAELHALERAEADDAIERALAAVPAGSRGLIFLPHLQGERTPFWDASLRGAMLGIGPDHDRWHQLRAVFEGVAHQLRALKDALGEAIDPTAPLRLIGGGGRSAAFAAIVASALALPLRVDERSQGATSVGAAQLAAVGVGMAADLHATRAWLPEGRVVVPEPLGAAFARAHRRWLAAVAALAAWHREA